MALINVVNGNEFCITQNNIVLNAYKDWIGNETYDLFINTITKNSVLVR